MKRSPSKFGGRHLPIMRAPEDDPYVLLRVYVPKSLAKKLEEFGDLKFLPQSKLVCIALDNELDQTDAFNYPTSLPTNINFDENPYAHEAGLIVEFLKKMPGGAPLDTLLLARRQIGIESRDTLKAAYAELLHHGLIEEYYPKRAKFRYHHDYRYARLVGLETKAIYKDRYKRLEGESTHRNKRALTKRFQPKEPADEGNPDEQT
jgi:hypothetical protein